MGHAKTVKNAAPGTREKIFHPQSRKADQIARSNLRKDKMSAAASIRRKRDAAQVDIYTFFFHALPPTGTLTLPELHAVVTDAWLPRHSAALDAERAARRPGRPPSAREAALAAATDREAEEYRSGLEVVDLTHPANVALFRRWDQAEAAYVQMLRFVRISSAHPATAVVSRPGKHVTLTAPAPAPVDAMDEDDGEAPALLPAA